MYIHLPVLEFLLSILSLNGISCTDFLRMVFFSCYWKDWQDAHWSHFVFMEKEKDHISQPLLLGYMAGFSSREHKQKWCRAAYKSIRISRPISLPSPPHTTPLYPVCLVMTQGWPWTSTWWRHNMWAACVLASPLGKEPPTYLRFQCEWENKLPQSATEAFRIYSFTIDCIFWLTENLAQGVVLLSEEPELNSISLSVGQQSFKKNQLSDVTNMSINDTHSQSFAKIVDPDQHFYVPSTSKKGGLRIRRKYLV